MPALDLFSDMSTQWNMSGNGIAIGLKYETLPAMWEVHGVPPEKRPHMFQQLRMLERGAVLQMQINRQTS